MLTSRTLPRTASVERSNVYTVVVLAVRRGQGARVTMPVSINFSVAALSQLRTCYMSNDN